MLTLPELIEKMECSTLLALPFDLILNLLLSEHHTYEKTTAFHENADPASHPVLPSLHNSLAISFSKL